MAFATEVLIVDQLLGYAIAVMLLVADHTGAATTASAGAKAATLFTISRKPLGAVPVRDATAWMETLPICGPSRNPEPNLVTHPGVRGLPP